MELKLFFDENTENKIILGELIEDKYKEEKVFTKKYNREVYLLKIDNTDYVLKKEVFKGPFALKNKIKMMYKNIKKLREKGFENTYNVKVIAEEKVHPFLKNIYYVTDYIKGDTPKSKEDFEEVMQLIVKLHELGHYHGDCKPENFVKTEDGKMVMIDSKFRRAIFSKLGMYKDVLRLQRFSDNSLDLNKYFRKYKRHFLYYIAILLIYRRDIFRRKNDFWKKVL
ncbi:MULTISPECIES: lipopolysaccharide kinase InaA family protein [Fusobacterium]|uniref:lipopolysaccharide kinase InaA family protein n=1 Tax=Fusobacterium TaxID=848 RepID=UPI0014775CB6|nr:MULTISPECIES: lipopolysaccharide kinase InaA family protein [Fusobacterium]NME35746.1 hypothetical protein [Fusobacterium sp. FSA-380-WT-3A]